LKICREKLMRCVWRNFLLCFGIISRGTLLS
jgi:hypothetical protein